MNFKSSRRMALNTWIKALALSLLLSTLTGCVRVRIPSKNYHAVFFDLEQQGVLPENDKRFVAPGAQDILATSTTVAFVAPDECYDVSAATEDSKELVRVLRLTCGVLLSGLESEATRAGFHVVSWRAMKDESATPLDKARALGIDLLFEVNELGFNLSPRDTFSTSKIRFYKLKELKKEEDEEDEEDEDEGWAVELEEEEEEEEVEKEEEVEEVEGQFTADGYQFTPLRVKSVDRVSRRCLNMLYDRIEATRLYGFAVTLDIKMSSVSNGRVLWYYQQTQGSDIVVQKPSILFFKNVNNNPRASICTKWSLLRGLPRVTKDNKDNDEPIASSYAFESEASQRKDTLSRRRAELIQGVIRQFMSDLKTLKISGKAPTPTTVLGSDVKSTSTPPPEPKRKRKRKGRPAKDVGDDR